MSKVAHLFLSPTGTLLENWQRAFPDAVAASSQGQAVNQWQAGVVWLRLSGTATIAEQIASVRQSFASIPLVVLSDVPSDIEALAVLGAAGRGYCNTHAGEEVLVKVAGVVSQGGLWIGESIMQMLLSRSAAEAASALSASSVSSNALKDLTEREREVAKAVAAGASNREIAAQLGITERTVKAHVGAVLEKLKVRDRLQLALLVKS